MTRVVVTRLLGGLGNQLFQWAAGASVARDSGAEWMIDARLLAPGIRPRLAEFGVTAPEWRGRSSIEQLLRAPGLWRICRATGWRPRVGRTRLVFDRLRGFDPSLPQRVPEGGTLVMTGYWQMPQWARSVEEPLRAKLPPPIPRDAVAIHVRRGDYASDPRVARVHGAVDHEYYRRALDRLGAAARDRELLLFSDDPARVLAEGWLPSSVTPAPTADDVTHLRMMAGCAHLIAANSSFSWWAGWLGERSGRVVIAPRHWWTGPLRRVPHPAPEHWLRF